MKLNWFSFLNLFLFGDRLDNSDSAALQDPYLNKEALVVSTILPGRAGRVSCEGSLWSARCHQLITLTEGTVVKVSDRDNITLLVEPMPHLLTMTSQSTGGGNIDAP